MNEARQPNTDTPSGLGTALQAVYRATARGGVPGVDCSVLLFLVVSSDWRDPSQGSTCSTEEIARSSGFSRSGVTKALCRLTSAGIIVAVPRRGTSTVRRINWSVLAAYDAGKGTKAHESGTVTTAAAADDVATWEAIAAAWSEVKPVEARQLRPEHGLGAELLRLVRRGEGAQLLARIRHAARGASWHARAVRGEIKGTVATESLGELLGGGKMAITLDRHAAANPDDRPTAATWRTSAEWPRPERTPRPDKSAAAAADLARPTTPASLRPAWERALERLRSEGDAEEVDAWLKDAELLELDHQHARVLLPNAYYADWCREHFAAALAEALHTLTIDVDAA